MLCIDVDTPCQSIRSTLIYYDRWLLIIKLSVTLYVPIFWICHIRFSRVTNIYYSNCEIYVYMCTYWINDLCACMLNLLSKKKDNNYYNNDNSSNGNQS